MIKTVADYLDITALRFPDKVAFDDGMRTVSFSQFRDEARRIASAISKEGLFKCSVAVYLEKKVECLSSIIGVTYSGNYYTVLDIKSPQARLEKIISSLHPSLIITDNLHQQDAALFAGDAKILLWEDTRCIPPDDVLLRQVSDRILTSDVMFVLFTSGSTGMPKGVVMPHKAVIPYVEWGSTAFPIDENTVFCSQAPFYYVASCFELFQTLKSGAKLCFIPQQLFLFPIDLLEYLNEKKATFLIFVPSVICMIANLGALGEVRLESLQYLMFGGEAMPAKQLNMWRRAYPWVKMVNVYGMTEMMDDCVYYRVERELDDTEPVPIGFPCEHADVFLIDENGKLVAPGEVGELYGRGPSIAYGYYNDPNKTAGAFVQNPLQKNYPEIVYRTGDICRINEFGEIVYICRKDFQIKHMGNRIELGEIETVCSALEEIERSCCLYNTEKAQIVLFYEGSLEPPVLRAQLKNILPEYMHPHVFKKMGKMPLNPNGKINRTALKELI